MGACDNEVWGDTLKVIWVGAGGIAKCEISTKV